MWLELEHIPHQCHAQLAAVRQNPSRDKHGVALLLHWLSRSTLELACHLPSCGLGATVGWVGVPNFFPDFGFLLEGRCITQPTALKALHWNLSVWCRTCARGGGELVLYCFRPSVDSPSKSQWGSILLLVRDLAPYSTPLLLRALSP